MLIFSKRLGLCAALTIGQRSAVYRLSTLLNPPPTLPNLCRVTTIKVLGFTITNHLSVSDHGRDVISKCSQCLYALKVLILRCHGMNDEELRQVYKAVVIAKLLYASPAWWEYMRRQQTKQRVEAFIRRGVRLGLYRADDPTTTQLTDKNDDNLFSSLLSNGPKQLLPDKSN